MKLLSRALFAAALIISGSSFAQEEMPPGEAPQDQPGLPPDGTVAPPPDQAQAETASESDGQWTYTDQYGWVWIPYAQQYTYVAPSGDTAYEYCYDQTQGWSWMASPWVLGYGPMPYWGGGGVARFAWYAHPWFPVGAARGGSGYRSGGGRTGYASGAGSRGSAVHGATPVTPAPTQQIRRIPHSSAPPPHSGGGFHTGGRH